MLCVPFSMLGTGMLIVRRAVKRGRCPRCDGSAHALGQCAMPHRSDGPSASSQRAALAVSRRRPALVLAARSSIMSRTACSTAACQSSPNRAW